MTGMSHAFLSGYSRVRGCRIPRSGDTQRGKNVAYFFSVRSRALAKAIVLKRQDNILFLRLNAERGSLFINPKSLVTVF